MGGRFCGVGTGRQGVGVWQVPQGRASCTGLQVRAGDMGGRGLQGPTAAPPATPLPLHDTPSTARSTAAPLPSCPGPGQANAQGTRSPHVARAGGTQPVAAAPNPLTPPPPASPPLTLSRPLPPQVRLATFSQHHVDGLDLALTPLMVRPEQRGGEREVVAGMQQTAGGPTDRQIRISPCMFLRQFCSFPPPLHVSWSTFQHSVPALLSRRVQIMQRTFPDVKEPELRGHLSSFGVPATLAGEGGGRGGTGGAGMQSRRGRGRWRGRRAPGPHGLSSCPPRVAATSRRLLCLLQTAAMP